MDTLKYNGGELLYNLTRRSGMKTIRLKIKADGSVCVSADTSVPIKVIEDFMLSKLEWVLKHKDNSKPNYTPAPEICDNMPIKIFGEEYILRIMQDTDKVVNKNENILTVKVPEPQNLSSVEFELMRYIAEQGREIFTALIKKYIEKSGYKKEIPRLALKSLKSKWGHYNSRDHEIMLNFALCGVPFHLSEYVAAHEVAHLFIRNHSSEFYSFGEKLIPGFKKLDRELNKYSTDWKLTS